MKRFHKPGDEKRMIDMLDEEHDAWLDCPTERMNDFMRPHPADRLEAEPGLLRR